MSGILERPSAVAMWAALVLLTVSGCTDRFTDPTTAPLAEPALRGDALEVRGAGAVGEDGDDDEDSDERSARPETETYLTIDVPGGTFQGALDINDRGVIVGRYRRVSDGRTLGYRRSATGELTTIEYPGAVFTVAAGINNRGDIVGQYSMPEDAPPGKPPVRHGYLLRDGVFTSFDPPGSIFTNALAINDRGTIVGRFCSRLPCRAPGNGDYRGYVLTQGEFRIIDYPGANETNLWDINARGLIVGSFGTLDGKSHVFTFKNGRFRAIDLPGVVDIDQDKGGINSRGDIVGVYCDLAPCHIGPRGTHGFLLSGKVLTTIDFPGAPGSLAFGINARRDIAGWYFDAKAEAHGFVRSGGKRSEDQR